MAKRNVIFRADGHSAMGLGHLVRSGALAEMLAPNFVCHLVYRECPEGLLDSWGDIFTRVIALDTRPTLTEEAADLSAYAAECGPDPAIVVLDGYHFTEQYQQVLVAGGHELVCIDDIHATKFLANLVINHAPAARARDYTAAPATQFALGLRFALLRAPFRAAARDRRSEADDNSANLFVCLGGADPDNVTLNVLQRLQELGVSGTIDLVLGAAYRHTGALDRFLAGCPLEVRIHRQLSAEAMAQLMSTSARGITSPSTVSLEYLSAGGQLYLQPIAANQAEIHAALVDRKLAREFADFPALPDSGQGTHQASLFDGMQDVRLRKLFGALDLTYREATAEDSDLYFQWANDPLVREQSFDSRPIDPQRHQRWFGERLMDKESILLVFERRGKPVGQVRLSLSADEATIGYSVSADARGAGLGLAMLHYAASHLARSHPAIERIVGYVKHSNPASLVTFRRLGYQERATEDYPDAVKFELHEI